MRSYDLGKFDRKGSVSTKYETRDEYINAVHVFQVKQDPSYYRYCIKSQNGSKWNLKSEKPRRSTR